MPSPCSVCPQDSVPRAQLWTALAWVSGLTFLEIAGAIRSGSMALWGEAAHFLADGWGFGVALFAATAVSRASGLSYGRGQALALGGLVNGLAQGALGVVVGVAAARRLMDPMPLESASLLGVAVVGLAVNAFFLIRFGGLHMHEDDATEGVRIHFLADLGLCVATVLAAMVIHLGGPLRADAILAILAALVMEVTAWRLIRRVGQTLLSGIPTHLEVPRLLEDLQSIPQVSAAHHLHVWQVGREIMGSVHLVGSGEREQLDCANAVMRRHGITHATVQMEREVCSAGEASCQGVPGSPGTKVGSIAP